MITDISRTTLWISIIYNILSLYLKADKLVSKSTFPESASNNEWARFLYYLGELLFLMDMLNYS